MYGWAGYVLFGSGQDQQRMSAVAQATIVWLPGMALVEVAAYVEGIQTEQKAYVPNIPAVHKGVSS